MRVKLSLFFAQEAEPQAVVVGWDGASIESLRAKLYPMRQVPGAYDSKRPSVSKMTRLFSKNQITRGGFAQGGGLQLPQLCVGLLLGMGGMSAIGLVWLGLGILLGISGMRILRMGGMATATRSNRTIKTQSQTRFTWSRVVRGSCR